jgi:hypothetical protein
MNVAVEAGEVVRVCVFDEEIDDRSRVGDQMDVLVFEEAVKNRD